MPLRTFDLPHGKLYVNEGPRIEAICINDQIIKIYPKKAHFVGKMSSDSLGLYFTSPVIWEAQGKLKLVLEKNKCVNVLLDISKTDRLGDNLMLTVVATAFKELYGPKVYIGVKTLERFERIWKGNPFVDEVVTRENRVWDIILDLNHIDVKLDRKPEEVGTKARNRTDLYLEQLGLYAIKKTPVYIVTEKEKLRVQQIFQFLKHGLTPGQPLVAIASLSFAVSRTYPHMDAVVQLLQAEGYDTIVVDEMDDEGNFLYSLEEMAAIIAESDVVVTADSAALHLAGAFDKRIVGIFGSTEGEIICDSYPKAVWVQGKCSHVERPCWWNLTCLPGDTYLAKEAADIPSCMTDIDPVEVVNAVKAQLVLKPKVFATMLTYNLLDWTKRASASIRSRYDTKLFVVDNKSTDGTQDWLEKNNIHYISKRCCVSAAQNIGVAEFLKSNANYFLLLNNDIVLRYDTIDKMVEIMEGDPSISALTAQEVMGIPPWTIDSFPVQSGALINIVDIPHSAYSCTMFRRDTIEKVGPFDEHFTPRYIEDNDYNIRIRLAQGTFKKTPTALYYHLLGGVLNTIELERRDKDIHWNKNIAYYIEKWGFHPHSPQDLKLLGVEHRKGNTVRSVEQQIRDDGKSTVIVRRGMGGWGDIIFISVVAREFKRKYGDKVSVFYDVPEQFKSLIRRYKYIDGVAASATHSPEIELNLTDVEFRQEWQEVALHGEIKSPRTKIHLDIAGLPVDNLQPDFIVKASERAWAEIEWKKTSGNGKRIVIVPDGSNPMKAWHGMALLTSSLIMADYKVVVSSRKYSFFQMSALISLAHVVVSPDTGLSNVAGALNIPVITLFSNRNGHIFEQMFPSMVAVTGKCPFGLHRCDYKVPCANTEGPYRPKEFDLGEPPCFQTLTVKDIEIIIEEILC
jgi:ADP-heptose:LPS heptosyltransferase/GT2 family glycosyltransferase